MTDLPSTAGAQTEFHPVAQLADLPPNTPVSRRLPSGTCVVLINLDGEICALADRCSHEALELSAGEVLPDGTIECAWHGARFDCRTGAVRSAPAYEAVPVYAVRIRDGIVLVGPPRVIP